MVDEIVTKSCQRVTTELQPFENLTMKEITLLREWNAFTKTYELLHFKAYTYFKYINYGLMIPIIILTSMSGSANIILSAISSSSCKQEGVDYPHLMVGFSTIIAAILTTIYNFVKVPEFQQRHLTHSSDFNTLSRQIEMELVLFESTHNTYSSLEEFIKTMRTRLDRLVENAPPIPSKVINHFCSIKQNAVPCRTLLPSLNPDIKVNSQKDQVNQVQESSTCNQDVSIQIVVDEPSVLTSPTTNITTNKGITTRDVIKNIEEFKLQRKSNEFERFIRNMKIRSS